MRKNEYKQLSEFTSQYIGVWGPSDEHWLGLDFCYQGTDYRFHTGRMYADEKETLSDGREIVFRLYQRKTPPFDGNEYLLLGAFATMDEVLGSTCIAGVKFKDVIMDDDTELLGQD